MQMKPKNNCPLNGFEPCKELSCAWFTLLRGEDPQSEQEIDEWGCAVVWLPVLLVENAQQSRQAGAAVESFRNEMVSANKASQQVLIAAAGLHGHKLIGGQ